MKTISKIEIATQNAQGKTTTGLSVHGPGKCWQNLVAWDLQEANVPSGDLVHLCFHYTDGTHSYQFFNW
jgi:hypothetical protein